MKERKLMIAAVILSVIASILNIISIVLRAYGY